MYLSQNIAHFRKLCGYTQEQLAEQLGVTGQSVSKWENGITNPDVSILPQLSKILGVDINALFSESYTEPRQIHFDELPNLAYDEVVGLFLKAQLTFDGKTGDETESSLDKSVCAFKEELAGKIQKCAYMIAEGDAPYGSLLVSDALTFIDRSYGCIDSALLFDLDKTGEVLSVLGKRNNRKVLKYIYEKLITGGEEATREPFEEMASTLRLSVEEFNEAVAELRHIALLDEHEKIENSVCKKEVSTLDTKDFIFVIAILRLAYVFTSKMTYTTLMYRDALNQLTYVKTDYNGNGL